MNSKIHIRRVFHTDDLQIIAELAEEIWTHHYTPIIGEDQVRYMLDSFQGVPALQVGLSQGHELYLADWEGQPTGYLMLIPDEVKEELMVSKLYVQESSRGKGVGAALMDFARKRAAEFKVPKVWLTVNRKNHDAIAWYKRKGFHINEEVVTPIGKGFVMDDYRMECPV